MKAKAINYFLITVLCIFSIIMITSGIGAIFETVKDMFDYSRIYEEDYIVVGLGAFMVIVGIWSFLFSFNLNKEEEQNG